MVATPIHFNDIEICVKAAALNFRDIMVIIKLQEFHTLGDTIGCDFSGVVTEIGSSVSQYKIGDEVFGMSTNSSVASHVFVNCDSILHKPKEFTFAEASTIPSVFLTAYYCLVTVASLKQGETLLIHVASGGVGLVAIQIAQHIKAKIIATAGNKRKRAYLRSLGIQHVFHSRDLTYGDEFLKSTNGKGVDVVLNSLTGQGFKETSLKICSKNARFVEMGKLNIWQPGDVQNLRSDVKYTNVNLETVMRDQRDEMQNLMIAMKNFMREGVLKPLPYTRFFVSQIKDALNYFMKAQHIVKKIVITMPELKESLGKHFTNDLVFNANGTYLVTGGLGGLGWEVAKWMVKSGARNVVLVGRTAPDENAVKVLKSLSTKGCRVISRQVDVGEMEQCKELFKIIKSEMPPLRGVIHSAGTLSDATIQNQTWEKFEIVFQAKVKGGWNLHNLTKDLSLEHFVLFSSMAGLIGTPGQSNHSAANTFLDSLAYYRHSLGLPAQTINWGAWSELGAAKDLTYTDGSLGLKPIAPTQGISALKFCMSQPILQIGIIQMDWSIFPLTSQNPFFSELNDSCRDAEAQSIAQGEHFWNAIGNLVEEERAFYIRDCIEGIIRITLKLPESETIDEYQTFTEMGLDSLMAVEIRRRLQQIFGKHLTLNPTSLLDYPTLSTLSKYLAELTMTVNTEEISVKNDEVKSSQESFELAKKDCILLESVKKVDEPVLPSKIKNVLLTGVTGHFGPYMLDELNKSDNIHKFCLIRAKSLKDAEKKLESNLKKFNLLSTIRFNSISVILGDITIEDFGMMKEDYDKMAFKIDAIIHCAVKANQIESYIKSKSNKDIRSVNVLGTLKVLKFASTFRTKRVIFTSSYTAANVLDSDGFFLEELPSEENTGEGLGGGYTLTKFVGEKLMKQALQRGIPCTVLRFPTLIGHSETGLFTLDTNALINVLLSAMRMNIFFDLPGGFSSMPVDVAAKIACCIIFNDNAQTGLYNIVSKASFTSKDFVKVANEMGLEIQIVDEKEFMGKMMQNDNPLMSMFKETIKDQNPIDTAIRVSPAFKYAIQGNKELFRISNKLLEAVKDVEAIIPSTAETMRRQLIFAKNTGIFDSLGIKLD